MVTRRQFLKASATAGAGLALPMRLNLLRAFAQAVQGTPLPGSAIPQFIDPLPLLSVAGGPMETITAGTDEIVLSMQEFQANVMPSAFVPATGTYAGTYVWGYRAGITPTNPAGTYIGPVIVATRGTPTQVKYVNNLGNTAGSNLFAWTTSTDQTLHWANPDGGSMMDTMNYGGPIPAVPHLHGGEVPPVVDGGPDAWFLSSTTTPTGYMQKGQAYYTLNATDPINSAVYRYPNTQEAAMIWFHDHVLGATRLNVYAGLAGAYALIDGSMDLPAGLHPVGLQQGTAGPVDYLIPLVLQDRMFDTNGQLFFPNVGINTEHPFWLPEFVGDTIVVNGKVWPFLNVEPRRYRFLIINGSNARAYELFLANPVAKVMGPPIWQIGTDGGYLDAPVKIDPNVKPLDKLVMMPGERADIIIDFSGFAGQTLIVRNTGRTPYPKGASPAGSTLGQILQIRVGTTAVPDASYDPASGIALRTPMIRLVTPATGALGAGVTVQKTRQLTLNEVMGAGGPLEVLVNNTKWNGIGTNGDPIPGSTPDGFGNNLTELPNEGETEVWEIVNLTADAHPIHLHLVQFQLMNRQSFNTNKYGKAYNAAFPGGVFIGAYGPPLNYETGNGRAVGGNPDITPYLQGPARPPAANEAGWKDTVIMYPGEVTRIVVRWAPTDLAADTAAADAFYPFDPNALQRDYVWHCHIIDHEDNEMMRPDQVMRNLSAVRKYFQGTDY